MVYFYSKSHLPTLRYAQEWCFCKLWKTCYPQCIYPFISIFTGQLFL